MPKTFGRYSPSRRFDEVRSLLNSTGGATIYEIAERLGISVRTAIRYLRALEQSGERLYDETEGKKKIWRLMPSARQTLIQLTTSQMISLFLSRRVFDFLGGTGFKEDLDEIFKQLESALKRKDFIAAKNLDRKIFDVNEAPYHYEGRIEDVNDIITALVREERLSVTHGSVARGKKSFLLDPYTLLVYKKGLYLAGLSHHHRAVRTFALDGFKSIDWKKGDRFEMPDDYEPAKLVEGAFGLFGGPRQTVRIFFDAQVTRYVRRRQWHPTQRIEKVEGGIELVMEVHDAGELQSWILSFGDKAEVRAPDTLRRAIAEEARRAAARYATVGSTDAPQMEGV
jgi:predicted DNA-binding transcriptional regulator YafY